MTHHLPRAGRFVWHDLLASDPGAERAFYARLFPWTFREHPEDEGGLYTYIHAAGRDIGGIQAVDPASGEASRWLSYVSVDDLEVACATIVRLGGEVRVPPTDVPGVGRYAVASDPARAVIAPMQWDAPSPEPDPGPPAPGIFCWDELLTPAPRRSTAFYGELCRWTTRASDGETERPYWVFVRGGGHDVAGMMPMPAGAEGQPASPPYIATGDVDAAVSLARDLRAKIRVEPTDLTGIGRFAVVCDPAGATFAVFQTA